MPLFVRMGKGSREGDGFGGRERGGAGRKGSKCHGDMMAWCVSIMVGVQASERREMAVTTGYK